MSTKQKINDVQDELQKCENFKDSLFNIWKYHSNKINIAHININYFKNKFDMITNSVTEQIEELMISATKLYNTFPQALYHPKHFSNQFRLDRNSHGSGILVYVRDSNLVKLDQKF